MTATQPPLQKFSNELTPKEILGYMLILYQISLNRNISELNRFLKLVSSVVSPDDFNKLLRRVIRMMGDAKCGKDLCSDWLMTNLYELYKAFGTV